MSWQATAATKRLVRDPSGRPLRTAEKLLLFTIADSVDPRTGVADLSQKLLAQQALCSMRTVQRLLNNLQLNGLLEVHGSADRRGYRYRLTYALPEEPKKGDNLTPFQYQEGRQFDALPPTGRATNGSGKGDKRKREGRHSSVAPSSMSSNEENGDVSNTEPSLFVFAGLHFKVTTRQHQLLAAAFPWVELQQEYRRMDSWLEAHPRQRPTRHSAFVHNWLARIDRPNEPASAAKRDAAVGRLRIHTEPPRCIACDVTHVDRAGDCCSLCKAKAAQLLQKKEKS